MSIRRSTKLALLTSVLLCACASPTVVQSVKPGDNGLSCSQLQNEYSDAERLRVEAEKEKSLTGGNVVRALFFWPAILGTASNANEAIAAADTRKVHLVNQMNLKKCAVPLEQSATSITEIAPTQALVAEAEPKSKKEELIELKRLYDDKLITKDAYTDRQKAILSGL